MEALSNPVVAVIGGIIAILLLMLRQSGKKAGVKQAKQEAAAEIAAVKEEAINAKADQIQALPPASKYTAVLQQFLHNRRASKLGSKN